MNASTSLSDDSVDQGTTYRPWFYQWARKAIRGRRPKQRGQSCASKRGKFNGWYCETWDKIEDLDSTLEFASIVVDPGR
jgi:hypothetical protein